jgi:hypothetical protein
MLCRISSVIPERLDESWTLNAGGTAESPVCFVSFPSGGKVAGRQALTEGVKATRMSPFLIETKLSDLLRLAALGTAPLSEGHRP